MADEVGRCLGYETLKRSFNQDGCCMFITLRNVRKLNIESACKKKF